jgi:hypothetical protein
MKYITFINEGNDSIVKQGEYATEQEAFDAGKPYGWCSVLAEGADGKQAIGFAYNRAYKQQNGRKGLLWSIVLF